MNKTKRNRIISIVLGLCILAGALMLAGCGGGGQNGGKEDLNVETVSLKTAEQLMADNPNPTFAAIGGEWIIKGLTLSKAEVPEDYYNHYYDNLRAAVKKAGGTISENRYTDYARVVIALAALGKDAKDVEGYDLVSYLDDYEKVTLQGTTSAAFALIAAQVSGNTLENEEAYIDFILEDEMKDALMEEEGFSDYYAMGAEGLSFYRGRADVDQYIEESVQILSDQQGENGAMTNCESTAEAIEALVQLGIDPEKDERFIKNGKSLYDGLMTFYVGEGRFKHLPEDEEANAMASERALLAMDAILLYQQGRQIYEAK